jgi:lactoylglutathione lyase
MKVIGVHHTSYTISNLERSLEFYVGLLGCELLWQREISDKYFCDIVGFPECTVRAAHLSIPGSEHVIELFEYVSPEGKPMDLQPNNPGSSHLAFVVEAKGVNFRTPPVTIDAGVNKGGYGVYILDPDGITMELFQPPKGDDK